MTTTKMTIQSSRVRKVEFNSAPFRPVQPARRTGHSRRGRASPARRPALRLLAEAEGVVDRHSGTQARRPPISSSGRRSRRSTGTPRSTRSSLSLREPAPPAAATDPPGAGRGPWRSTDPRPGRERRPVRLARNIQGATAARRTRRRRRPPRARPRPATRKYTRRVPTGVSARRAPRVRRARPARGRRRAARAGPARPHDPGQKSFHRRRGGRRRDARGPQPPSERRGSQAAGTTSRRSVLSPPLWKLLGSGSRTPRRAASVGAASGRGLRVRPLRGRESDREPGDQLVPEQIAPGREIAVGGVADRVDALLGRKGLDRGAWNAQERTEKRAAPLGDPRQASSPEPASRRSRTVSTWSSRWWAVRIRVAPVPARTCSSAS